MANQAKRPFGVTIMALLSFFQGFFGLLLGLGLVTLGGLVAAAGGPVGAVVGSVGVLFGFVKVMAPLVHLVFAWGAFHLKVWAWWMGLAGSALSLLGAFLDIAYREAPAGPTLVSVAIPALIFLYLISPGVRQAFKPA
jgi:hypothetical protein